MSDQDKRDNSDKRPDYSYPGSSLPKELEKTPHERAMGSVFNAAAWGTGAVASLGLTVASGFFWAPLTTMVLAYSTYMISRVALTATVGAVNDVLDARKAAAAPPPPAPPPV